MAQNDYLPIVSPNHQWIGRGYFPISSGFDPVPPPAIIIEFEEAPEMFEGKLYHRLRYKYPTFPFNNDWQDSEYIFREENGKMFAVNTEYNPTEFLIFDISAEVGDTISIGLENGEDFPVVILSDSSIVTDDGLTRKLIEVYCFYEKRTWVEGIGAAPYGLFDVSATLVSTDVSSPSLFCFLVDNERIWSVVPDTAECYTIVSVEDHPTFGHTRLYPNPTTDVLTIDMDGYQDIFSYDILSLTGAHIRKGMAYPGEQILVQDLAPGMYILRLQARGGAEVVLKWVRE
jgi:hypothetical protein